jgi:hypothetical protein
VQRPSLATCSHLGITAGRGKADEDQGRLTEGRRLRGQSPHANLGTHASCPAVCPVSCTNEKQSVPL